jgi:hypothetical protein
VAELHRTAFRQLAGGLDHGGGSVELGRLAGGPGLAPSIATRALATLRSILAFAVADARVQHNVAALVRRPTSGSARREGQALTLDELVSLTAACRGRYRDVVPVLALAGLRWGELAGLQVGDLVSFPGPGLRLRRAVLAGGGGGALYVDTLKNNRAPTGRPPGRLDLHLGLSAEPREPRVSAEASELVSIPVPSWMR